MSKSIPFLKIDDLKKSLYGNYLSIKVTSDKKGQMFDSKMAADKQQLLPVILTYYYSFCCFWLLNPLSPWARSYSNDTNQTCSFCPHGFPWNVHTELILSWNIFFKLGTYTNVFLAEHHLKFCFTFIRFDCNIWCISFYLNDFHL